MKQFGVLVAFLTMRDLYKQNIFFCITVIIYISLNVKADAFIQSASEAECDMCLYVLTNGPETFTAQLNRNRDIYIIILSVGWRASLNI